MPPFGNLFELPVLMDENLAIRNFSLYGGTHRDVICMAAADCRRLVNPLVASFARSDFATMTA